MYVRFLNSINYGTSIICRGIHKSGFCNPGTACKFYSCSWPFEQQIVGKFSSFNWGCLDGCCATITGILRKGGHDRSLQCKCYWHSYSQIWGLCEWALQPSRADLKCVKVDPGIIWIGACVFQSCTTLWLVIIGYPRVVLSRVAAFVKSMHRLSARFNHI